MATKPKTRRLLALRPAKPPRLTEEVAREAIALRASTDLSVATIAGKIGLTANQLHRLLGEYPDFGAAFAEAGEERRQEIVAAAKASMMRRIKGYSYTEAKKKFVRKHIGESDDEELVCVESVTVNRHVEPSDRMIEFALLNYAPDEFKARKGTDGEPDGEAAVSGCTPEEAKRIADEILA